MVFRRKNHTFAFRYSNVCATLCGNEVLQYKGKVLEWLKRHAWKACNRQNRFGGSNPPLSAFYIYYFKGI